MILNYQRNISKHANISETGNIIELSSNNYSELLEKQSINFKKSYLLEEDSLISTHALAYREAEDFPERFHSKNVIHNFLYTVQICKFENNKLKLFKKHNLPDFLHLFKKQIEDLSTLFESSKLPSTIDDRVPNQLIGKQNFLGQINYGCGFSFDGIICTDIECHSDYAWIQDGICLIYFGGSLEPSFFNLLPFKIEKNA